MRTLHLMSLNEKNGFNCFRQLHEVFDLSEHRFLVMADKKTLDVFPKYKGYPLHFMPKTGWLKRFFILRKEFKKADAIIFNSLIFNNRKYLVIIAALSKYLDKAAWIEWGGDLYNWRIAPSCLKNKFYNYVNSMIRSKVGYVGLTFEADEYEFSKQFPHSKAKLFYTPLPFHENRRSLVEDCVARSVIHYPNAPLRVQVSHNSIQVNNHITTLYSLSCLDDGDFQVFLPVSYGAFGVNGQLGGQSYKIAVCSVAKSLFGKRAFFLNKQYPLKRYLMYLRSIDVAIFDSERPIGLANIYYLLQMGKKVYLNGASPQYRFLKSKGVRVFDSRAIPNMTFTEFAEPVNDVDPEGFVAKKFTPKLEIKHWGALFDAMGVSK